MDYFKIELAKFVESEFPGMRYKIVNEDTHWFYIQACSFPFLEDNDSEMFHYEFNWGNHGDVVLENEINHNVYNGVWKKIRKYLKYHITDPRVECLKLHEKGRNDCCWKLKKGDYNGTWKDGILILRSIFGPVINEFINKELASCLEEEEKEYDKEYIPLKKVRTRLPSEGNKGTWNGERRGYSKFVFDKDCTPPKKTYSNPGTIGNVANLLGDQNPEVNFKNNFPQFDRDGGTKIFCNNDGIALGDGTPFKVVFEEGIMEYLDEKEIFAGKTVNRERLHEEAFKRMANELGVSVDMLKTFKGDLDAAKRLITPKLPTTDDVLKKYGNPHCIHRVFHECEDCKTLLLVPRVYHDNVEHLGGIYVASRIIIIRHNKESKDKYKMEV